MRSNKIIFSFAATFIVFSLNGQACDHTITGKVTDEHTGDAIAFANIYIAETASGAVSDENGIYVITNLCSGQYHLNITHIGCDPSKQFLELQGDTVVNIVLDHNRKMLHTVKISAESEKLSTAAMESMGSRDIQRLAGRNLSDMLAKLDGVSALRTGNGVSKPVVHGLYGNRLTIVNNGVTQRGQQWGNDHSPEIDPLSANKITVVKGTGAVEYQGSSLGTVILVDPQPIARDPHVHGNAHYFFQSNGFGNGLHAEAGQYNKILAWKLSGTLKKNGDFRTSDIYLRNTGLEEGNYALQLEKEWNDKLKTDLYFSAYNARIGILRGSQIGNLTDLQEAINRPQPFFTQPNFSYEIGAPKQEVGHQLLKVHSNYKMTGDQNLDFSYAFQRDRRKEFDIRRSGRSQIPSLSLEQINHFYQGIYGFGKANFELKSGVQIVFTDNINVPETGILPLIPDYYSTETGAFISSKFKMTKWLYEFGARYDLVQQSVAAISQTLPREIVRYENTFQNYTLSTGISWTPSEPFSGSFNLGLTTRNPAINELYSNGLHQGVSGLELGNPDLKGESAVKATLQAGYHIDKHFSLSGMLYYQRIDNYIYLQPQQEFRLTIRGAFPVFNYAQTNAAIYGTDLSASWIFQPNWKAEARLSLLRGEDLSGNLPLIYIPSNNARLSIHYDIPIQGKWENLEMTLEDAYVFKQARIRIDQDFLPPPDGYNLLNFQMAAGRQIGKNRLQLHTRVDNLLNTAYRDYLNRQRYFSDDLGINVSFGANFQF